MVRDKGFRMKPGEGMSGHETAIRMIDDSATPGGVCTQLPFLF